MSDGATHNRYYKKGWILIFVLGGIILFLHLKDAWLYSAFLIFNYWWCSFVDPDMDQIGITLQEGRALRGTKRFGCFVGFFGALWVAYWFMYAWVIGLVGGHRSWASHGVVIGTIFRMFYFNFIVFWIVLGIGDLGRIAFGWKDVVYNLYLDVWLLPYLSMQLLAWLIADQIHLTLDLVWVEKMLGTYGKGNRK